LSDVLFKAFQSKITLPVPVMFPASQQTFATANTASRWGPANVPL